jgi:hypothetical protein
VRVPQCMFRTSLDASCKSILHGRPAKVARVRDAPGGDSRRTAEVFAARDYSLRVGFGSGGWSDSHRSHSRVLACDINGGRVDHSVRSGRTAAQSVEVFNSTSMHPGTSGDERTCRPASGRVSPATLWSRRLGTSRWPIKPVAPVTKTRVTVSFAAVCSGFEGPPVVEVGNEPSGLCWAPSQPFLR